MSGIFVMKLVSNMTSLEILDIDGAVNKGNRPSAYLKLARAFKYNIYLPFSNPLSLSSDLGASQA